MVDTDALFRIADAAQDDGRFGLARRSFERGAALGSVDCITRLAYIHDVGIGIHSDKQLAMRLYRKAWRLANSIIAANNIAVLYREIGRRRTMFKWFESAATCGDGSAQLDMTKCYLQGVGVRRNIVMALRCLAVASQSIYVTEAEREEAATLLSGLSPRPV